MSEYDAATMDTQNSVQPARPSWDDTPEVDPGREKLVNAWTDKIRKAEKFWEKVFKQMKTCRQLAREGALKDWLDGDNYVVPLAPRHINTMVSALYAKDPRVEAKPRKKLMYTVWDGSAASLQAAMQGAAGGDLISQQIMQEIEQVKQYNQMVQKLGKTLELCWNYFTQEQKANFKSQMKALVRRAKINGVGYVKLGFQRALRKNPEITAGIQDVTSKIAAIEAGMKLMSEDMPEYQDETAKAEELRLSLADLQSQETIVVREGPIFDFPRSDEIIFDTKIRHLKSMAGAKWYAHRLGDFTP
jgi:hypothetical protein